MIYENIRAVQNPPRNFRGYIETTQIRFLWAIELGPGFLPQNNGLDGQLGETLASIVNDALDSAVDARVNEVGFQLLDEWRRRIMTLVIQSNPIRIST
jgi:hypothetical protein